MKKAITTLCLMMLILLSCSFAYAETRNSGMFYYEIKGNGTAKITGYNWDKHTKGADIYIPRMLDGYTVTEIGEAAFAYINDEYYSSISCTVPYPYAKHSIGSLTIPDTIRTIGDKAFMNISMNSYSLAIPASVEYIGSGAFANVAGLEQFVVASGNPTYATIDGILYNKQEKELVAFPLEYDLEQLPKTGIYYHRMLTVPDGIVKIGDYAFFNVNHSIKITLPGTLTTIGNYAFAYSSLSTPGKDSSSYLTFPDTLENIGEGAFFSSSPRGEDYYKLIDLSNTKIAEIPALAFARVGYLDIKLPNNLESIGECAFWDSHEYFNRQKVSPITFIIPSTVTKIESKAFYYSSVRYISFAEGSLLTSIGDEAFSNCDYIKTLDLPQGLKSIGDSAFADCSSLSSITIPASVKTIGENICDKNKVRIDAEANSYAALWASENGYTTQQAGQEDTSWLN